MLHDLVLKNRSYRRFDESFPISYEAVRELIALARICPCAANRQFFKFRISTSRDECEKIFPLTSWAGYIKDGAPKPGERPVAYITIVSDTSLGNGNIIDVGIMAQTMLLGAAEAGLGGCMIASFKREELKAALSLDDRFEPVLVIALGKPIETVVIDDMVNGDIKYWRDENKIHHVPKRSLDELIL
ncbi:MAG: nitroreductase family protein [Oscillospiraceae bacterium]|nr:nitroreductase family protein [Oscillospiraceae bacterium]